MSTLKVGAIRGVSASSDAITVANDGTCTSNITNNLSNRNIVINGAMTISQRGTSFSPTGNAYCLDRFAQRIGSSFNMDTTITQATDAPSGFTNSLKISPDSTATPSGSENATIRYIVEGQDCDALAHGTSDAKKVTLSFYAKSASSNNNQVYTVQLTKRNTGGTRYYLTQTFTVTSSWQRFTMSFAADTTNNLKNDNTEGMQIYWHLASGPDDIVSAQATWLANNGFRAATGQSNFFDNTSNEFYLTGVQLEVDHTGSGKATDFEHRTFADEIIRCERYYRRDAADGVVYYRFCLGQCTSSTGTQATVKWPTRMRAAPTFATSGTLKGYTVNSQKTPSSFALLDQTTQGGIVTYTASGLSAGNCVDLIAGNDGNAYVEYIAEL